MFRTVGGAGAHETLPRGSGQSVCCICNPAPAPLLLPNTQFEERKTGGEAAAAAAEGGGGEEGEEEESGARMGRRPGMDETDGPIDR